MDIRSIKSEVDVMSSDQFAKAKITNNWVVFSQSDIDNFLYDVRKSGDEVDIEKARKDVSKLIPKIVTDSIGRQKTVWVKPIEMIKKQPNKTGVVTDATHEEAMNRHHHNTKVQRMGREASFKQVERHYGKDVTNKLREMYGMNTTEVVNSDKVAKNLKTEPKEEDQQPTTVVYKTEGNNKITVHPDALLAIRNASGNASTHEHIEAAKNAFMGHMKDDDYSEKQSLIAFHKYIKSGNDNQIISNDSSDNTHFSVSMKDKLKLSMKKEVKPKSEKKADNVDPEKLIGKYAEDMAKQIEAGGVKVDARWRSGLVNNFTMLKQYIDNNDYGMLKDFLAVKNTAWRNFFTDYTGIKLPASDKDTSTFLFKHTGAIND